MSGARKGRLHGEQCCRAVSSGNKHDIAECAGGREEQQEDTFKWFKQWYPLRVAKCLEPDRPHHAAFLGKDVVLWRDGDGKWNCFGDMCPHRY